MLAEIQRRGGIGPVPIDEAIAHAEQYVAALPPSTSVSEIVAGSRADGQIDGPGPGDDAGTGGHPPTRLVDLGSGGGLPALVIVARRPDLHVTMVERRAKRADLLRYGVRGLDATTRTEIVAGDLATVLRHSPATFDLVTARSFGPLTEVLRAAALLLRPGGRVIVSEPPEGMSSVVDRAFVETFLPSHGLVDDGRFDGPAGSVHRWRRSG